jgi:fucose 4-O-acetylase-like acetyltransferase
MTMVILENRPKPWVDLAKGFAIILVVIGHTVLGLGPSLVTVSDYGHLLTEMIYLFHMPLFFALSGVVFIKLYTRLTWQNWISRILKLTWTMVLWTYVFLIAKLVGGDANNDPISFEALFMIPIPGILHFWFLWDIIVYCVLMFPLIFIGHRRKATFNYFYFLLILSIFSNFYNFANVIEYWVGRSLDNLVYFSLGFLLAHSVEKRARSDWIKIFPLMLVMPLLIIDVSNSQIMIVTRTLLLVSILIVSFMAADELHGMLPNLVANLGRLSLAIYVMHTISSAFTRAILLKLGVISFELHLLAGVSVGLLGPLLINALIQKLGVAQLLGLPKRTFRSA